MIKIGDAWVLLSQIEVVKVNPKINLASENVYVHTKGGYGFYKEFKSLEGATAFAEELVAKIRAFGC